MTDEDNNMNDYTYLFKALSNPVRLKILALCSQKPMTSKELRVALGIGISKPLLLAHLKILIKAGLIQYDVEIDSERGLIRKNIVPQRSGSVLITMLSKRSRVLIRQIHRYKTRDYLMGDR